MLDLLACCTSTSHAVRPSFIFCTVPLLKLELQPVSAPSAVPSTDRQVDAQPRPEIAPTCSCYGEHQHLDDDLTAASPPRHIRRTAIDCEWSGDQGTNEVCLWCRFETSPFPRSLDNPGLGAT